MKNLAVLRWSVDLKKLIIGLFCIFVVSALHAEVSDDVWKALINQNVIIEKNDGSEVAGKLASVADQVVVVIKTNGKVVSVPKEDVQNVRVSTDSETTAGKVSVPKKDVQNVQATAGGFALSAGAGGAFDFYSFDIGGAQAGVNSGLKEDSGRIELKAFIDATYLQASIGYIDQHNPGHLTTTVNGSSSSEEIGGGKSYVTFAAYLEYPFVIGPVKLFPLLGIEYRLNLTYKDGKSNDLKSTLTSQAQTDLNELWFEAGAGADITFGRVYIRPELLIGSKLRSTTDNNFLSFYKASGATDTWLNYLTFNINLLVGYKF